MHSSGITAFWIHRRLSEDYLLINIASLGPSRRELTSKRVKPMYDSVGVVNTLFCPFFGKRAQRISLVWRPVSRAPFFGVHLDP